MKPEKEDRIELKFVSDPGDFIITRPRESSKSNKETGEISDYLDKKTVEDYYYVMDTAFYDETAEADVESAKKFAEENPEEAEEL